MVDFGPATDLDGSSRVPHSPSPFQRIRSGRRFLALVWERLGRPLESNSTASLVFATVLMFGYFARGLMAWRLFCLEFPPLSFVPTTESLIGLLRCFVWEVLFALVWAVTVAQISRLFARISGARIVRALGWTTLSFALLALGFITSAHQEMIFETHVGLTHDVLTEWLSSGDTKDVLTYGSATGILLGLTPLLLFGLLRLFPARGSRLRARLLSLLILLSLLLQLPTIGLLALGERYRSPRWEFRAVSSYFVTLSVIQRALAGEGRYGGRALSLPLVQAQSLRMMGTEWDRKSPSTSPPVPRLARAQGEPWNVVFLILESTGADYVFDTERTGDVPMPFLKHLAESGLHFSQHYASANTSPRAIFSMMSGVYPKPAPYMFCMGPDVRVPGLGSYLGSEYDVFWVTPSRIQSYFPRVFLNNSGVHEIYGFSEIPESGRVSQRTSRNELDAVDFFLTRLEKAREPFFATYYSFAPHYHYYDYGPEYRIAKGSEAIDRYYNNLRLLDTQIARVYRNLESTGRLSRTALVLVGDHGEAFGQHPDNWTHSRGSYNENFRTPAIFYQPLLFAPTVVDEITSHVDILPTLLDALGVRADTDRLQGDSVFDGLQGEYRFLYGNEDTLSSVSRHGVKLQILFREDKCRAFDLKLDPGELHPIDCDAHEPQLDATLRFWSFQRRRLPEYNRELMEDSKRRNPPLL